MAYRLSFWRMNRSWQRLFSWASAVVGLLLVASLAYAGAACASPFGAEAPGLRAAGQERCLTAGAMPDACVAVPQRIDVLIAADAPSFPETPPAADRAERAARIFRTAVDPQPPVGLAPASSLPAYILLRRYLS